MARTKKELKDQDTLLGSEIAEAGADGAGLVPGEEPDTPPPADLEPGDGAPQVPNVSQTEVGQEQEGGQPPQTGLEPGMDPADLGEPPPRPPY